MRGVFRKCFVRCLIQKSGLLKYSAVVGEMHGFAIKVQTVYFINS